MDDVVVNETQTVLKANQIACLECNQERLYGEVIQFIPQRQLCWFRPMYLLVSLTTESNSAQVTETVIPSPSSAHSATDSPKYSSAITTKDLTPDSFATSNDEKQLIDLRSGSDLLWPAILFRPALDTEVIDFLTQLREINPRAAEKSLNHKYLHTFLRQVWRSHQEKFSSRQI